MPAHRKPELAAKYWELYEQGFSCEEVAKAFGATRQSVWEILRTHGYDLRRKKQLPFIEHEGKRYTPDDDGYYRCTERDRNIFLHRVIWEQYNGSIPNGYQIHHINGDKSDNRISNLECLGASEHKKLHCKQDGVWNSKKVRRLDTGETYESVTEASRVAGVSYSAIARAIQHGWKSAGTKWEYI